MSDNHGVSRREALQGLGVIGAATVLGGAAPAAQPSADVVATAVSRMTKGHS